MPRWHSLLYNINCNGDVEAGKHIRRVYFTVLNIVTGCNEPSERRFHRWCGWCRIYCSPDCQDRCPGRLRSRRYPAACPCRRRSPWPTSKVINKWLINVTSQFTTSTPFALVFRRVFSIFAKRWDCTRCLKPTTLNEKFSQKCPPHQIHLQFIHSSSFV